MKTHKSKGDFLFITRQCDYAIRTIRILAKSDLLSVGEICAAEHIPQPYAYKILKKLEKAKFLSSVRGTNGGYRLVADTKDISLYDIYAAVEGGMYLNECLQEGYDCPNNIGGKTCAVHRELCELQKDFIAELRKRNMKDILED